MKETLITTGICLLLIAIGVLISWSGQSDGQHLNAFINTLIPLVSAFIGAYYASHLMTKREKTLAEKGKIDIANKWTLHAENARSSLIAIKSNYHGELKSSPLQRCGIVPIMLLSSANISGDYSELSFIAPIKGTADSPKWSQIPRIRTMIENYNILLTIFEERNALRRLIQEEIAVRNADDIHTTLSYKKLCDAVGPDKVLILMDLTEQAIKLTDDLLIELNDFMHSFPERVQEVINTKSVEGYGRIIFFAENEGSAIRKMLERSPELNYEEMSKVLNMPQDQVREKYSHGYDR